VDKDNTVELEDGAYLRLLLPASQYIRPKSSAFRFYKPSGSLK
jgi:hypothetical protein